MSSLGLPQDRRLRQSGDFARIKNEGQRVVLGCLIVNWTSANARRSPAPQAPAPLSGSPPGSPPGTGPKGEQQLGQEVSGEPHPNSSPALRTESQPRSSRVGVITSSRIGNAVVRSRARRLLREAFRLNQHAVHPPADLVLIARASIAKRDLAAVQRDFLEALRRARLLRCDASPAPTPKP